MLGVRVLGELAIELDGREIEPPTSRRARSLLGLLVVDRRVHLRSQLAARFWPDVLDESARTSLRGALSTLRKALGPGGDQLVVAVRDGIALGGERLVWTDYAEFDSLIGAGRLDEALALRRGELLEGLDDDWVLQARDEHRDRIAGVLARLARGAEERGELREAIALTRREVALDPLAEEPQRELIRRLGAGGDRPAAMQAYRRLQKRLRSDLGIAPSARTRELVESLRATSSRDAAALRADAAGAAGGAAAAPQQRPSGTVTLLFTDEVSSTETLLSLGDDEAQRRRHVHFRLLREVAAAHRGQEVKSLGDGLMVAFASAVDAVACAIGIQQAVAHQAESEGRPMTVRVGLNVGEPIVDEGDYFGTPVVLAKRLCDAADGGQILAADVVRTLVGTRGGFEFRRLDPIAVKGMSESISVCDVRWEGTAEQRVPLPPPLSGTTTGAFVGRTHTLEALARHAAAAAAGERRVVLISGEPGIGKTRLVAESCRAAHARGAAVLAGRCHDEMVIPFEPFGEALRDYVASCPPAELTGQSERGRTAAHPRYVSTGRARPGRPARRRTC
jgi:class 3 adenylate cyclase